jgi:ABC-type glycerol-3-phosphate transport system substrate-binding protein
MLRVLALVLGALILAPIGAHAGYYAEEHEAVREIIAAFEQDTGKQVELVFYAEDELPNKIVATFEVGQPPDFAFGLLLGTFIGQWAFEGRLVDLTHTVGHFTDLFDPDVLSWAVWLNASAHGVTAGD